MREWLWKLWWKFVWWVARPELERQKAALDKRYLEYVDLRNDYILLKQKYDALMGDWVIEQAVFRDPLATVVVEPPIVNKEPLMDTAPDALVDGLLPALEDPGPSPEPNPPQQAPDLPVTVLVQSLPLPEYLLLRLLEQTRGHEFQASTREVGLAGSRRLVCRVAGDVAMVKLERIE